MTIPNKILVQKKKIGTGFIYLILCSITAVLLLNSCEAPPPKGISRNSWYICEELNLAFRFQTSKRGEYIGLNKALAKPKSFRLKHYRKASRFKFNDRENLKGELVVQNDRVVFIIDGQPYVFIPEARIPLPKSPHRYENELFEEVSVTEIIYGQARGFYSSKQIEKRENKSYGQVIFDVAEELGSNLLKSEIPLQMDIYQAIGDEEPNRPLIVLMHGGAFIAGDKRDELVSTLAMHYARRGFVVASVNYRLGYLFLPGRYANLDRAIYSAIQDIRAALRYLSHHRNQYRIDPDYIYLGGNSAGGILSLSTAFMKESDVWPSADAGALGLRRDLGCLDCSTNDLYGPFTIQAVINMWGAVHSLDILDSCNIPILSIHGDKDLVVPYGHDYPFTDVNPKVSAFFSRKLHGSFSIHNYADTTDLKHTLYTFVGLKHEPHFDEEHQMIAKNYHIIHDLILHFINKQLIDKTIRPLGPDTIVPTDAPAIYKAEHPFYEQVSFDCNHCLIHKQSSNTAEIIWLEGKKEYALHFAAFGPHGQVVADSMRIVVNNSLKNN